MGGRGCWAGHTHTSSGDSELDTGQGARFSPGSWLLNVLTPEGESWEGKVPGAEPGPLLLPLPPSISDRVLQSPHPQGSSLGSWLLFPGPHPSPPQARAPHPSLSRTPCPAAARVQGRDAHETARSSHGSVRGLRSSSCLAEIPARRHREGAAVHSHSPPHPHCTARSWPWRERRGRQTKARGEGGMRGEGGTRAKAVDGTRGTREDREHTDRLALRSEPRSSHDSVTTGASQ